MMIKIGYFYEYNTYTGQWDAKSIFEEARDMNDKVEGGEEPQVNGYPLWSGIPAGSQQTEYPSGMRRDAVGTKPDYTLLPRFMLDRVTKVMQGGIAKGYGRDSWQKANTPEELEHFKRSAWRHFLAWQEGDTTEDHYASLIFNLNGAELLKTKLLNQKS